MEVGKVKKSKKRRKEETINLPKTMRDAALIAGYEIESDEMEDKWLGPNRLLRKGIMTYCNSIGHIDVPVTAVFRFGKPRHQKKS